MARSGCFQGTGSGSGGVSPSLNVLPWLSALGGVASEAGKEPVALVPGIVSLLESHWPSPRQLSTPRVDWATAEVQLALTGRLVMSWAQALPLAQEWRPGF